MKEIVDNLEEYLSMSKQENLEFLDQLYHLMNQINADAVDYQGLKIHHAPPLCPDCQSNRIVKNGFQGGQQMYICRKCGRHFRVTTGTFVYRIQKKEKMLDYIRCMLEGKTLRACAKEVGISLPTSFAWRHRILAALRNFEDNVNFFGIVEVEELLMNYSEKGRRYRNEAELAEAREKKKKKVAVIASKDRTGNMLFKQLGLGKIKREQIEQLLNTKVSANSGICFGHNDEFRKLKSQNLERKEIVIDRVRKRGVYSVATIRRHVNTFVGWINNQFRGVATKYLQSYIMWYVVMHKYLLNNVVPDVGRMLNLASSDRRAWYVYRDLRASPVYI
ncbi:MAG: IS1595 family transposase [Bacteroidales bacterium]